MQYLLAAQGEGSLAPVDSAVLARAAPIMLLGKMPLPIDRAAMGAAEAIRSAEGTPRTQAAEMLSIAGGSSDASPPAVPSKIAKPHAPSGG